MISSLRCPYCFLQDSAAHEFLVSSDCFGSVGETYCKGLSGKRTIGKDLCHTVGAHTEFDRFLAIKQSVLIFADLLVISFLQSTQCSI